MGLLLFVAAVVTLGLAGWNSYAVIDELRRALPPQFNELDLRWASGAHVWTPITSDAARRYHVRSHLWASLSFSLWAILLWLWGELIGAAAFGGLAVLAVTFIAWQCYHYRVRRQRNSN